MNMNLRLSSLIEIFFIMGFTLVLYKSNAYILYGFIPLFLFLPKRISKCNFFIIFLFIALSVLYLYVHGISASFRVFKTLVILLPFFFTNSIEKSQFKLSILFYYFMRINAILVCLDFILFLTIGNTMFRAEVSGFMPRTCGLFEDSNFFSYTMIIYIYYVKWKYGKYDKLCVLSLFLSGSFSAIFTYLVLYIILRKNKQQSENSKLRYLIFLFTILGMIAYDLVAIHSDTILDYVFSHQWNDLLKVKVYSISHRFTTISNAFSEIGTTRQLLFGIGPGMTRTLSESGLNLHNSLLQIILEMGIILFAIVCLIIIAMVHKMRDLRFVILFCAILFLSSIMETIYSPILSLVYFLSLANYEQVYTKRPNICHDIYLES